MPLPLTNINLLSDDSLHQLSFDESQIELVRVNRPIGTITEFLHLDGGRSIFSLAVRHGLIASDADAALLGSGESFVPHWIGEGAPTEIPDCTTSKDKSLSPDGECRKRLQRRNIDPDPTPKDWTDAQKECDKTAQDKASQNRKIAIGSLIDEYKCTDPDCPDPALTIKILDLAKVYSRQYKDEIGGTWVERGWESKWVAPAKVVIRCSKVP